MTTHRKMIAAASLTIATLIFPAFAMAADRRPAPAPRRAAAAPRPASAHVALRYDRDRRDGDHRDGGRHDGLRIGLAIGAAILAPAGHYETVYQQVLVSPARYEVQCQQVMVAPAHYETQYIPGGCEVVYDSMGNPHTVTVPARTEQILVPAQYQMQQVQVLVPAVYETRAVTQWVCY
ncbi:MAG: hypothetical protein LLG01_11570 [Planctomycetaceae bacterium]|nr:hypothetical protein [Planctomycetaceae bacterium]